MSQKRSICIVLGLGILIGSWFAFTSWFFKPEVAQAQCVRLYLASGASDPPTCAGGGTRISSTQGSVSPIHFLALCIVD